MRPARTSSETDLAQSCSRKPTASGTVRKAKDQRAHQQGHSLTVPAVMKNVTV